jgi:antiviral helicase SKI2
MGKLYDPGFGVKLMFRYKAAGDSQRRKQDKEREAAGLPPVQRTGGRGGASNRARDLPTGRGAPHTRIGAGRNHTNRGGGPNGAPVHAPSAAVKSGRGGGFGPSGGRASHILDQNVWTHLINHLKKNKLLPVVNFVFSKKRCEEYASNLSGMDLCDAKDKSEVVITWEKALNRLKGMLSLSPCVEVALMYRIGQDSTSNRTNEGTPQSRYRNPSWWSPTPSQRFVSISYL